MISELFAKYQFGVKHTANIIITARRVTMWAPVRDSDLFQGGLHPPRVPVYLVTFRKRNPQR